MEEIFIFDKQKYLNENYPFDKIIGLSSEIICIHCNTIYKVEEYKVFRDEDGEEFICCPNAPDCNGTVIDWIPIG
jgi:hypothetical protein